MSRNGKVGAAIGVVLLALATLVWSLRHPSEDPNANVADFARSIDDTKGNTPSVPADRRGLGRTGIGRGR